MKNFLQPLSLTPVATLTPPVVQAGGWEIDGGIAHQQPAQQDAESELIAAPFPFHEGKRLSLSFGSIVYVHAEPNLFQVALEGQVRLDGYDLKKNDALTSMDKRNPALDTGLSESTRGQGVGPGSYQGFG